MLTKRLLPTGTVALLAVAGLSGCDAQSPAQAEHRQVTVIGSGEVQGMPDTLTADVGIEVTAPDVTAAMNQAGQRQRAVIDALTARGIDAKDISTTSVSLQPQYGENAIVVGYRASNSIRVTMRELDVAPSTLAIVVNAGGNAARINGVSYSIADDSDLVSDARARAFTDAENRASQYADLAGLSLGSVISISEASGGGPTPPPMPMERGAPMAAADVPLSPGEQTVTFSVTAVWELR